jgi:multidrug efflux pump subunit AcrB
MPKIIPESLRATYAELEAGFLGFWVRKYRISFLIVLAIIVLGGMASVSIPKESSPSIKFGLVVISTVFPGANPIDIDGLITDKIYKEIKDIEGAKKITSASSLGVSSVSIELQPETDVAKYINDVRNKIGRVVLPKDAKTPNVIEITTQENLVLNATMYSPDASVSLEKLRILGADIKEKLELAPNIQKVDYGSVLKYDIRLVIDKEVLKGLGITIADVANTIRSYHQDAPIGNYGIGTKNYDFRIHGKFEDANEVLAVPLVVGGGRTIKVGDIVTLERSYDSKSIQRIGFPNVEARDSVSLAVSKNESAGIFAAAKIIKSTVDGELAQAKYAGVSVMYTNDMSDTISDDYRELAMEALTTLVLVFIVMWLFIGFQDSLFATLSLPLAFLCTFILLDYFGYSLNFLTNFSLILSFGIAVDTIIVIVQAASAKIRI